MEKLKIARKHNENAFNPKKAIETLRYALIDLFFFDVRRLGKQLQNCTLNSTKV
jgi:hypothetical protein